MMSSVRTRKNTYLYIEYLRVISILSVIVVHVSGANWFHIEIGSPSWIVQTFYNVMSRFGVSVFCMISGALLLQPGKEISTGDLFSKYIKRILACYVWWLIMYALLYTVMEHGDAQYFVMRLVKLPDHLWYLLMLMGFYLVLPVLRQISKNRAVTRYLILLLIAWSCTIIVTQITGFFKDMAGDSYAFAFWTRFLSNLDEVKFAFLPGYLALFFLGHYIHEYGLGKLHRKVVLAAVPCLFLSALLTVILSMVTGKYIYSFMLETNPLIVIGSAGIFAFFKERDDAAKRAGTEPKLAKTMIWLGSNTFGIFLIHFAIRELLAKYAGLSVASYPSILSVPINSILLFVISLGLTALFKKIPGLNRVVS